MSNASLDQHLEAIYPHPAEQQNHLTHARLMSTVRGRWRMRTLSRVHQAHVRGPPAGQSILVSLPSDLISFRGMRGVPTQPGCGGDAAVRSMSRVYVGVDCVLHIQ